MLIKDYLDLQHFNWKYIKENESEYHNKQALYKKMDLSDIEGAMNDKEVTEAHHMAYK